MNTGENPAAEPTMTYVYAVGRERTPVQAALPGRPGLEGAPLRTVGAAGLIALVSSVPAAAYGTEGMQARMEDLERLEALARDHHRVVEDGCAHATVLPMRLATVYLDDERVRQLLTDRRREFTALLDHLEGHVELGVKVYADPRAAAPPADSAPAPAADGPGRAYLRQRRAQRQHHQDAYRAAGAVAAEVPARVAGFVSDHVSHRPQQGELATGAGENIANEAYLVPVDQVPAFRAALAGIADGTPGVRVEITGPWAPYSFSTPPPVPAGGV
ncbi:GvpL/GvpF family gas vesicle protein [Streptomyces nitrosporeus]|uniref:GvpL/GvpF family gas vesicle protein n=1 Tax=Streptomyces nitrosporeus TaxID=28894 RepID=UPI00332FA8AE